MCSKPEKWVQKIVLSDRTKIYANDPRALAFVLAGRFKGTADQFDGPIAEAIRRGELLQAEDEKGLYYESRRARVRRLAEASKSPKVGYVNTPSLAMSGGSR